MNTKIIVTDIKVESIKPAVPEKYKKLLPTRMNPEYIEFTVSSVSNAISNGLRRTICDELLTKRIGAEYENLKTTDPFIITEMVLKRLKMIPLDQRCPDDAKFELNVSNNSAEEIDVKSSEFKITHSSLKQLPFDETYTICTLKPGKSLKISDIKIVTSYGFLEDSGMFVLGINTASKVIDIEPLNVYEDTGKSCSLVDPRKWKISFNTNGDLPAKKIVAAACDNLIDRARAVHELLYSVSASGNNYILTIPGESDTIGNLFMRTILDLFPDIPAVVYTTAAIGRTCTLKVRTDDDINNIIGSASKQIMRIYAEIKSYFA